jgi:hypothetical protein
MTAAKALKALKDHAESVEESADLIQKHARELGTRLSMVREATVPGRDRALDRVLAGAEKVHELLCEELSCLDRLVVGMKDDAEEAP